MPKHSVKICQQEMKIFIIVLCVILEWNYSESANCKHSIAGTLCDQEKPSAWEDKNMYYNLFHDKNRKKTIMNEPTANNSITKVPDKTNSISNVSNNTSRVKTPEQLKFSVRDERNENLTNGTIIEDRLKGIDPKIPALPNNNENEEKLQKEGQKNIVKEEKTIKQQEEKTLHEELKKTKLTEEAEKQKKVEDLEINKNNYGKNETLNTTTISDISDQTNLTINSIKSGEDLLNQEPNKRVEETTTQVYKYTFNTAKVNDMKEQSYTSTDLKAVGMNETQHQPIEEEQKVNEKSEQIRQADEAKNNMSVIQPYMGRRKIDEDESEEKNDAEENSKSQNTFTVRVVKRVSKKNNKRKEPYVLDIVEDS